MMLHFTPDSRVIAPATQLLLDLIELGTRNHLLALNALGVRWIGKGRK